MYGLKRMLCESGSFQRQKNGREKLSFLNALLRTPAFNLTEVIRKWRQVNGCKRENLEKNLVIRCQNQNIPLFGYL